MELGRVTPDSGSPEDAGDLGLGERSTRPPSPSDSTSTSVSANKPASLLAYFGGRSIAPRPDSSIERTLSEQAGNKKTRAKMAQTLSSSKQTLLFSAMPTSSEGADEDLSANSASGGSSRWQLGIPKTDDITSGKAVRGRKRKKATKDEEAEVKAMVKAAKEAAKDAQVLESDTASKGKKTGKQEANAMLYEVPRTVKRIMSLNGPQHQSSQDPVANYARMFEQTQDEARKRSASVEDHLSTSLPRSHKERKSVTKNSPPGAIDNTDEENSFEITAYNPGVTEVLDDDEDDDDIVMMDRRKYQTKETMNKPVDPDLRVHPFFGGKPVERQTTPSTEGKSNMTNVTSICAAAVSKMTSRAPSNKPPKDRHTYNIFSSMASTDNGGASGKITGPCPTKAGWNKDGEQPQEAKWPTEEDCHVKGPDMLEFRPELQNDLQRRTCLPAADTQNASFWEKERFRLVDGPKSLEHRSNTTVLPPIPSSLQHDPAFIHIFGLPPDCKQPYNTESWTEKYRPRTAEQVLGNRADAGYLKSWLQELELGAERDGAIDRDKAGLVRKEITRKVVKAKRQRMDAYDSWLVDDSDPISGYASDPMQTSQEEFPTAEPEESFNPAFQKASRHPSFRSRLTNSILLYGPSGSGKTTAVYAVAEELDWEIFEVYPGIGKRSGANLGVLVGDISKNHMVGKGGTANPSVEASKGSVQKDDSKVNRKNDRRSLFAPRLQRSHSQGSDTASAIAIDNATPSETVDLTVDLTKNSGNFGYVNGNSSVSETPGKVRQSLILLEEVDILFDEDKGFWQAVISLIAESKRPVVMTCNDLTTIPFIELALQTTLLFSPAPFDIATSYLQAIAQHEGAIIATSFTRSLIQATRAVAIPEIRLDQPLPPGQHVIHDGVDLRAAIMQLQVDVASRQATTKTFRAESNVIPMADPFAALGDLAGCVGKLEALSAADAWLPVSLQTELELLEVDRLRPSNDDEVGINALLKPACPDRPIIAANSAEQALHDAYLLLAFGESSSACQAATEQRNEILARDRSTYIRSTLSSLDWIIPLDSYLLPHPALFLDYIPAISNMVAIDDRLEQADADAAAHGDARVNRQTGRVMRLSSLANRHHGYRRQLPADLDAESLREVRAGRLDVSGLEDILRISNEER